jgi:hypothetical protein
MNSECKVKKQPYPANFSNWGKSTDKRLDPGPTPSSTVGGAAINNAACTPIVKTSPQAGRKAFMFEGAQETDFAR